MSFQFGTGTSLLSEAYKQGLSWTTICLWVLGYVLIFSPNPETHLKHVEMFFRSLRKANLKLKASKCSYLKQHIQYLRHLISEGGIQPVPEKLESV